LRTNLFFSQVDSPPKVILVTSPGPREGKSITCANLGVTLTQADKQVLIVDCDLRKPTMHKLFELPNSRGVSDVLAGDRDVREIWGEPLMNLKVLTAGPTPPNPVELLGSRRFAEFLGQIRQEFDYVLIDSPPLGLVSDAVILSSEGDGVLLVLDASNTRKVSVRQAVHSLKNVGANVLATVVNNVDGYRGGDYSYR
jgi:capsular exopolysaccharide synthesis family protein